MKSTASPDSSNDPTKIDAFRHQDQRTNIPSDEHAPFVATDGAEHIMSTPPPQWDSELDPQLVWRGKDRLDDDSLAVRVVPIYIQERIVPRAIIENLRCHRNRSESGLSESELTLFDDFDGTEGDPYADLESYEHAVNWSNRLILGDALIAMTSLTEKEDLKGQVQTVYIDPPYGIKFNSNWQVSTSQRTVVDGRDVSPQPEQIRAFRDTWKDGIHSYLSYLRDRLVAARTLLSDSGSVFVQISDDNLHVVRNLLDEVFGPSNYVSTITFTKTSSSSSSGLSTVADFIIWYAKDKPQMKYRQLYKDKVLGGPGATGYTKARMPDGSTRSLTPEEKAGLVAVPASDRVFATDNLTSQRPARGADLIEFEHEGKTFTPGTGTWKTNREGMERLATARRLAQGSKTLSYIRYLDDFPAVAISNVWTDTGTAGFAAKKTYVVQTNPKVIERCLLMTSDPGDLVLDPTCGSGTTAVVAEKWGRRWITIDTSRVALTLAQQRIMAARHPSFTLADSSHDSDIRQGFVYRRALHIMLSTISRCEEIVPGMTQQDADAAIRRAADYEPLVDQPKEDKRKIRVAGPFTVESLSPHRTVTSQADSAANATGTGTGNFVTMVLDNLARAGVQNGYRDDRLKLGWLEPRAGEWVHALGGFVNTDGQDKLVAVSIGPESGTVGREQIAGAAKEAVRDVKADLLLVCAYAFDGGASEQASTENDTEHTFSVDGQRTVGRLRVLNTRINADLMMSEELKSTGAGNLFTVFGEPDITIAEHADELVTVAINGLDIFDPNTGKVRSSGPNDIACWFIDTDYSGEAFYVRHAYFPGGASDPYQALKKALKAEINAEAWNALYRTESLPFSRPQSGKIAVKAINKYGDEALKVFSI